MRLDHLHLTIDCVDPAALVGFWCHALGYEPQPPPEGHASWNDWYRSVGVPDDELDLDGDGTDRIYDPEGRGPKIWFQTVPEAKEIKNRLHLDLFALDRARPFEERRAANSALRDELVALGASVLTTEDNPEHDRFCVVMADPAGNEFCLG